MSKNLLDKKRLTQNNFTNLTNVRFELNENYLKCKKKSEKEREWRGETKRDKGNKLIIRKKKEKNNTHHIHIRERSIGKK